MLSQCRRSFCIDFDSSLQMKVSLSSDENYYPILQSEVVTTLWEHTANIVTMLQSVNITKSLAMFFVSASFHLMFSDSLGTYIFETIDTLLKLDPTHLLHGGQSNQYEFYNVTLILAQS